MSVLNQASDGLFNVLIVLVRALVRFGPKTREDLIGICGGEVDKVEVSQIKNTLTRWTELGLFGQDGDAVAIAEPHRSALGKTPDSAEARLPNVVRTISLLPANNARFWESEEAKSADLSRGIAWMLAQDIYMLDTSTDGLTRLETAQLVDSERQKIAQNNTRWNGLKTWMVYLGFARDGMRWTVDPSDALRDALPEIFGARRELTTLVFVERAAAVLPVLDGGTYRTQVESALKDTALPKLRPGLLSSSLSRAIQRLDREGSIAIERKSDTEGAVTLSGYNGRNWRDISHIRLKSGSEVR